MAQHGNDGTSKQMRTPIESGCPDGMQYMHPLMLKNFGNWKYHDRPRPGVLHHVAYSGDEIWTVRVGTQRQLGPYEINLLCDIIDQYGEGYVRFTIRSNMEVMVSKWEKVGPLIQAFNDAGYPGRRHRQLGHHDLAHAGLAALRHPRHRRFGRREIADGRALRRVHQGGDA